MEIEFEDKELREMSDIGVAEWFHKRFPSGASLHWWVSTFESLETSLSPVRDVPSEKRRERLVVGMQLLTLAVQEGEIETSLGAYWLIRFAALSLRFDPPMDELPDQLTPDGAAKWAIDNMPLSREQALADSAEREAQYENPPKDFYAPVDVTGEVPEFAPDTRFAALRETEMILSALVWISGHLSDTDTRGKVQEWLDIRQSL
ncbi:hypothetical protein [Streptomyces melanogenes]|uniref:hypothetical protein n=1 Tax=Streptomyces melanogenes TaxID=67326 RepID=UPI0037B2E3EB